MNPDDANNAPAAETKAQKITRLLAQGMPAAQIAKETGVSRNYVYIVKNGLANPRPAGAGPGRGLRKPVPFTPGERAAFAAALAGPPPISTRSKKTRAPAAGDLWTARQARLWFLKHFGRHPQRRQLADFAEEAGIMFKPEDPGDMEWNSPNFFDATFYATQAARIEARKKSATPKPAGPAPKKKRPGRATTEAILTEADIAGMELSNKKVQEEMAKNAAANTAMSRPQPIRTPGPKLGRNDPCPFNPGVKFKRCCGAGGGHFCTRAAQ